MNLAHPLLSSVLCHLVIGGALIAIGRGSVPAEWVPYMLLFAGAADAVTSWWLIETVKEIASGAAKPFTPAPSAPGDSGKPEPSPDPPKSAAPAPDAAPGPGPAPAQPPGNSDARFAACLPVTLKWEVGDDDDPRDPGGRTSRGILQTEWNDWRSTHPGLPPDVFDAPQDQIVAIYKASYWEAVSAGQLPPGIDLCVFDEAVLDGVGHAASSLEKVAGTDVDAEIGPLTIAAAAKVDPTTAINSLCDARLAYLRSRPGWPIYGNGWSNRVADVRESALAMAAPKLPPAANIPASGPLPAGVIPPWLATMRSLIGTRAGGDNPVIMGMVPAIAAKFPDMAAYAATYTHDSIAWCGHSAAYCMAMAGIRPPSEYLLAANWANWGTAVASDDDVRPGDVIVWDWGSGFHHVTFYDHPVPTDNNFWCCGGNQGTAHTVTVEPIKMAFRHVIRRPSAPT